MARPSPSKSSPRAASATNVTRSGALPAGLAFTNDGNGTATIAGTPTSGGLFTLTLTAKNTAGSATQSFVLTVNQPPALTSAASATATVGSPFSYAVSTSGYPIPSLTQPGSLPSGLSFTDNGNGTGTISGTPDAGTGGIYPITIAATNPLGSSSQAFTLTVPRDPDHHQPGQRPSHPREPPPASTSPRAATQPRPSPTPGPSPD